MGYQKAAVNRAEDAVSRAEDAARNNTDRSKQRDFDQAVASARISLADAQREYNKSMDRANAIGSRY